MITNTTTATTATVTPSIQEIAQAIARGEYKGLVVFIASTYFPRFSYEREDLIQEGNLGLVRALKKFDVGSGVSFAYYASYWIRTYIIRYLMKNQYQIPLKMGYFKRKVYFNFFRVRALLEAQGKEPTIEEMAEALEVPIPEVLAVVAWLGATRKIFSLQDQEGEYYTSVSSSSPEQELMTKEKEQLLRAAIRKYKDSLQGDSRKLLVLTRRLEQECSCEEVAQELGCTRQNVSLLEKGIRNELSRQLKCLI